MVATPTPKTSISNPTIMFNQDIIADEMVIPALDDPTRVAVLEIHLRGTTQGTPDIVTARTEAYIVRWRDKTPDDDF